MSDINSEFKCVGQIVLIPCEKIISNKNHPRKTYDGEELLRLSVNIKNNGVLLPISVRPVKYGRFEVISGERRLRASRLAGLSKIPSIIIDISNEKEIMYSLFENYFRRECNFFDEAETLKFLVEDCSVSLTDISFQLGISQSKIKNKLKYLDFSRFSRIRIIDAGLSEKHCEELLKLRNEYQLDKALEKIIKYKLNINQTKKLVEKTLGVSKVYTQSTKKHLLLFKDIKLFLNTINHAIATMNEAGISAESEQKETEDFIEYSIKIPKNNLFVIKSQ